MEFKRIKSKIMEEYRSFVLKKKMERTKKVEDHPEMLFRFKIKHCLYFPIKVHTLELSEAFFTAIFLQVRMPTGTYKLNPLGGNNKSSKAVLVVTWNSMSKEARMYDIQNLEDLKNLTDSRHPIP